MIIFKGWVEIQNLNDARKTFQSEITYDCVEGNSLMTESISYPCSMYSTALIYLMYKAVCEIGVPLSMMSICPLLVEINRFVLFKM